MAISDRKVVELKIEPDLSDAHVMAGLREAIQFSKENKCKSIFIVLVPDEKAVRAGEAEGGFIRSYTRGTAQDAIDMIMSLERIVIVFKDYVRSKFGKWW